MVAKMKGTFVERPKKQKKEEEPPEIKKRKRGQANAARYKTGDILKIQIGERWLASI